MGQKPGDVSPDFGGLDPFSSQSNAATRQFGLKIVVSDQNVGAILWP